MQNGSVNAVGKHEHLVNENAEYRRLFEVSPAVGS